MGSRGRTFFNLRRCRPSERIATLVPGILSVISGNGRKICGVLSSRTDAGGPWIGLTISSLSVQIAASPAFDVPAELTRSVNGRTLRP
jgi:hypothetical protein